MRRLGIFFETLPLRPEPTMVQGSPVNRLWCTPRYEVILGSQSNYFWG